MARKDEWPQRGTFKELVDRWRAANPDKTLDDLADLFDMKPGTFRTNLLYGKRQPGLASLLRACAVFDVLPPVLMGDRVPEVPGFNFESLGAFNMLRRQQFYRMLEIFLDERISDAQVVELATLFRAMADMVKNKETGG